MQENIEIILVNLLLTVVSVAIAAVTIFIVIFIRKLNRLVDESTESIKIINDTSVKMVNDYDNVRKNLHASNNLIKMVDLGIRVLETDNIQKQFIKLIKMLKA